jgi:hypothetical protein
MPELAKCDRRFEILLENVEATLYETNGIAIVQMALGDLTGGWVFNSWNGLFQPRD